MKIELKEVTIRELVDGYNVDTTDDSIVAYGGKLNVRPAYQREFVYGEKERNAVINTVKKGYPLNVMYWSKSKDGGYELLDGQQRTLSICQYYAKEFSIDFIHWGLLSPSAQDKFLDYPLTVYVCDGDEDEKLAWFETINIAGKPLTNQELRNAIYAGPWVSDAKRFFSKTNGGAQKLAAKYMTGTPIRQDYLETVLKWICHKEGIKDIREYMASHFDDDNADELINYFKDVIEWVESMFPDYDKSMKGVAWGEIYNEYGKTYVSPKELKERVSKLLEDEDVTNHKGIYQYVFDNDEKHLSIRAFTKQQKQRAYTKQKGICPHCEQHFEFDEMEADHIKPWSKGGRTIDENCQCLCKSCNASKSNK